MLWVDVQMNGCRNQKLGNEQAKAVLTVIRKELINSTWKKFCEYSPSKNSLENEDCHSLIKELSLFFKTQLKLVSITFVKAENRKWNQILLHI